MVAALEVESILTDRYQSTVPETAQRALKLGKRDKIHYPIRDDGAVLLTRVDESKAEDPVLEQFRSFLAGDIARHPERLQTINVGLVERVQGLAHGVALDLDAPLSADNE